LVVVTFLFWYQTWFGRRLSDQDMQRYLQDTSVPHKTQHALSQMAERMSQGDASVRRWYPQVLALARSQEPVFRLTAAWVMGQDNRHEQFHQALRDMLPDPDPRVQWNAALALVRFGDASGEPQLRLMLSPLDLRAPQAGVVQFEMKPKTAVKAGTVVAHIRNASQPAREVRTPMDGEIRDWRVQNGATVTLGESLASLSPSEDEVWEALRGLYFVGGPQDLDAVEAFTRDSQGISPRVRQQAENTAQAIRTRIATKQNPS